MAGLRFVAEVVAIGTIINAVEEFTAMSEIAFGSEAFQAIEVGTRTNGKIETETVTKSLSAAMKTTDDCGRIRTAIIGGIHHFGQIPETRQGLTRQRLFQQMDPCRTS